MKNFLIVVIGLIVAALLLGIQGCAAPRPMVDTKGVNQAQFEQDMRECQAYADQTYGVGTGAAIGAGAGYLLGQVLARTTGSRTVANEAGRGAAVFGAAGGAAQGAQNQRQVVQRCLAGRGYNVLN